MAIPNIEQACRSSSYSGIEKVALILETAVQWLNINLSEIARSLLKQIRSKNGAVYTMLASPSTVYIFFNVVR